MNPRNFVMLDVSFASFLYNVVYRTQIAKKLKILGARLADPAQRGISIFFRV